MSAIEAAAPARADSTAAVNKFVSELALVARGNARPDLEARLRAEAGRWTARGSTIVIAGETGSGKTSLVNALLDSPDLLPVDEAASTSVHVVLRYAPSLSVRVHQEGGESSQEIVLERIREWATEGGNPSNFQKVQAVEIGLDHPLLARGLVVVDTPGVGGLSAIGSQASLAALAWADALVFVTSARAPLSAPELAFLERAADRVETVILAVSKVDVYQGWRTILADDGGILGRRLPDYAQSPTVAVSSRLKSKADRTADADPEFARELAAESGVATLAELMTTRVSGRTQALRLGNLLRTAETIISELELPHRAVLAADDGSPEEIASYQANQVKLEGYAKAASTGLAKLADAFEIVRLQIVGELTNGMAEIGRAHEQQIADASPEDLAGIQDALDRSIADLVRRLSASLEDQLVEAVTSIAHSLAAEIAVTVESLAAPSRSGGDVPTGPQTEHGLYGIFRTHYYPFLMGSGITGTIGGLATAVGLASASTIGAPIAIASLAAGTITAIIGGRASNRAQARQRARDLVRAVLADARSEIQVSLQRRILETRRLIESELRGHLDGRTRELRDAVERGQRTINADKATRQRSRAEATQRLNELTSMRLRASQLRGKSQGRSAPATVGGQ
jgi:hypothetical protein